MRAPRLAGTKGVSAATGPGQGPQVRPRPRSPPVLPASLDPENPMKTIWKFELQPNRLQVIPIPAGGQILSVQTKGDSGPLMWVLVDPDLPLKDRFLGIYTTNTAVPDDPGRYVATFQIMDGMLEFHLFEMDEPPPEARLIEEPGPA